jgi:hypothetical protein
MTTNVLSLNRMNTRAVEFKRVSTATTVAITNTTTNEVWIPYAIQDTDGATNTFRIDFTPNVTGAGTYTVARQTTASNVPVALSCMPPIRKGDTLSVVGTVAANYLLFYESFPKPPM